MKPRKPLSAYLTTAVIAVFLANTAIKPLTTIILRRFGFRAVVMGWAGAAAVTLALCGGFTSSTPLVLIVLVLVASGVFRSVGFTAYNTIVFADIDPDVMSNANTLFSTVQQLTTGIGVAIGALALRGGAPLERLFGISAAGWRPFGAAFLLLAVVALLAAAEAGVLPSQAGSEVARGNSGVRAGQGPRDQHARACA